MKHPIILILILLCTIGMLGAQDWTKFYSSLTSGPTPAGHLLTNNNGELIFYYINSEGITTQTPADPYLGIDGWSIAPMDHSTHGYVGLKRSNPSIMVNPIYFDDTTIAPSHSKFIPVESDPQADHAFNLNHLDILGTKVAFSDTKLYYSIKNNATSFPTGSGITFYSYMAVLADPNADPGQNPTVFGLMYTVDVAGVISPGLYKITGTGVSDLERIGDVESSIDSANGVLTLSCNLADLYNVPEFSSWFDPDYPLIGSQAITSRISLTGGNQTSDTTSGANILLLPKRLNPVNESVPVISNPQSAWEGGMLTLRITYQDEDLNPPSDIFVHYAGNTYIVYPLNLQGFEQPVEFISQPFPAPQNWDYANFIYSVSGETYEYSFQNPVSNADELAPAARLKIYPNPTAGMLSYSFGDDAAKPMGSQTIRIYNLRGQLVSEYPAQRADGTLDLSALPAGIYYLFHGSESRRFLKL